MRALRRIAAATAAALTVVATTISVGVVAASPASATGCQGSGNSRGEWGWSYNGAVRARTTSYDSTCDGDEVFVGYLRDPYTDGYDAKVYIWDGTYNGTFHTTGGSSWSKFTYTDQSTQSGFWLDGYSSSAHHSYNVNNELELASYGY